MAYCVSCGKELAGDSANCPACGAAQGPKFEDYRGGGPMHQKGFFASLFDFSFKEFVTPRIVRVLYIIIFILLCIAFVGFFISILGMASYASRFYGGAGSLYLLAFIGLPLGFFLYLIIIRVAVETAMVFFRIHDELRDLNRK